MKKLYTLILAAASASLAFAQMPIMQQQVSFGMPEPRQIPNTQTELTALYNQAKAATRFYKNHTSVKFNAPSRAEGGLTRDELCKKDFIQSYTPYFSNTLDQEFWGDIYFTAGKGTNDIKMSGLFGYQENCFGEIALEGTFDSATQTISLPCDQLISQNLTYKYYFGGRGLVLNADKTEVESVFDYTADDSIVLSIMNFSGQYAMKVEGAWDDSWDVIPMFGFKVCDAKTDKMLGYANVTMGEVFYIAEPNADITYKYVHMLDNTGANYEILDYDGKGFINIMPLEEGGENAIQMGPFVQLRYGCPVMFVYDYGDYVANDTFDVGKNEYKNPAFIDQDDSGEFIYYYLQELTNSGAELGVYLTINTDENGYFESCDFDCEAWCAMTLDNYWFGECFPAHIQPIEFEVSGVNEIAADKVQDGRWFNLQGIEVNKDKLQKGSIYINNGKKVLVK